MKVSRLRMLKDGNILTAGFSSMSSRCLRLYDPVTIVLSSNSVLMIIYIDTLIFIDFVVIFIINTKGISVQLKM